MIFLILCNVGDMASAEIRLDAILRTTEELKGAELQWDSDVPLPVRTLLTQLKHQLRDALIETINTDSPDHPEDVQQQLLTHLQAQGIALGQCESPPSNNVFGGYPTMGKCAYGVIDDISLTQPPGHDNLIAMTTTLGIPCGTDSSLYLLRKETSGWMLILALESGAYDEITGAYGAFRYRVSPSADDGQFFVMTANITPWCSSNWQGLRYQVSTIGPTPYEPVVLLQRQETIWVPGGYAITTHPLGFRIEFVGNPSEYERDIDPDATSQTHIFLYDIGGNQIRETHLLPEDFLDYWLEWPWEEAAKLAEQSALPALHTWHERLGEDRRTSWIVYSYYESCPHNQDDLIMGITIYRDNDPQTPPEEVFFTLIQHTTGYRISGFYRHKPSECSGSRPMLDPSTP